MTRKESKRKAHEKVFCTCRPPYYFILILFLRNDGRRGRCGLHLPQKYIPFLELSIRS